MTDSASAAGPIRQRDLKLSRLCISPADWYFWVPEKDNVGR
jgi:hypothetical protein